MVERIPSTPPVISPLPENLTRPIWSVMIPTYNCSKHLKRTLLSVLQQDPGEQLMQIEVVDDFSTDDDVEKMVRTIGKGRVSYYRQPKNVGSLRNFETCINRSLGKFVHLLHGDDAVKDRFYRKMGELFGQYPDVGAAFCAYNMIREDDSLVGPSQKEAEEPGIIDNWLYKIGIESRLQYACIVVKREVYERLGSFYLVKYGEDWEMWARIAKHYEVAYTPEILAEYRVHNNSITGKSFLNGDNVRDISKVIDRISAHFPAEQRLKVSKQARKYYSSDSIKKLYSLWYRSGNRKAIRIQVQEILRLYSGIEIIGKAILIRLVISFPHPWLVKIREKYQSDFFVPYNDGIRSSTNVHIALAFDKSYFTPFYVLLTSIFSNNNCSFIFHVIATELSEIEKEEIVKFVQKNNSQIKFYNIAESQVEDLIIPKDSHFSPATYYRLYFPQMLSSEVDKLIYLDVDTVVIGDLSELYNTNVTLPVAAVLDIKEEERPELGIHQKRKYFNSGVMLLNLTEWKRQKISQKTVRFLIDFPEKIKWVDQDALNAILIDNWQLLDQKFNVTFYDVPEYLPRKEFQNFLSDKVIIHYTTHNKPWIVNCTNRLRYLYYYYLEQSPHAKAGSYWSGLNIRIWVRRLRRTLKEFLIDHTSFFRRKKFKDAF